MQALPIARSRVSAGPASLQIWAGCWLSLPASGYLVGLWRFAGSEGGASAAGFWNRESRMLLRGGAVMLMAGFLYGAWYAASDFERLQGQELHILDNIVNSAARQEHGCR